MENIPKVIIKCPHCGCPVIIDQLNCNLFRHGVFKDTNEQINPHATDEECDNYISKDLIYGCGKPFVVIETENTYDVYWGERM